MHCGAPEAGVPSSHPLPDLGVHGRSPQDAGAGTREGDGKYDGFRGAIGARGGVGPDPASPASPRPGDPPRVALPDHARQEHRRDCIGSMPGASVCRAVLIAPGRGVNSGVFTQIRNQEFLRAQVDGRACSSGFLKWGTLRPQQPTPTAVQESAQVCPPAVPTPPTPAVPCGRRTAL